MADVSVHCWFCILLHWMCSIQLSVRVLEWTPYGWACPSRVFPLATRGRSSFFLYVLCFYAMAEEKKCPWMLTPDFGTALCQSKPRVCSALPGAGAPCPHGGGAWWSSDFLVSESFFIVLVISWAAAEEIGSAFLFLMGLFVPSWKIHCCQMLVLPLWMC